MPTDMDKIEITSYGITKDILTPVQHRFRAEHS